MEMHGTSALFERIRFHGHPQANPDSQVTWGRARFTALTPRLLRLEWSETGVFEDRCTYAFPTRWAPAVPLSVRVEAGWLMVDTGLLLLRYRPDGAFDAENLSVTLSLGDVAQTWRPGTPDAANLRGTRRTLDGCEGDAALEDGLISRSGWALFDDSRSVLFDPGDGWVLPRPEHAHLDWYFFGYGHDYRSAVADYTRFGGGVPLIPRFVLGTWWSRYWAYSEQDLKELVGDFERHGLPLDVLVVDMDWHTPHAWTGYTWNRDLFPDPPAFLRWVHGKGLRVTLNLHPAQGVQPFEEVYPRFARAMGVNPASGEAIPFRIGNKTFVQNYFELLHHPLEDDGVDFWWVDWQQGEVSDVRGLDPLPWLNHLHFSDARRRGRRPLLYSRWGGLGNHRYPIGFSGDTYATWQALQFQPYLTASAANVAYGWWSHDIGGHQGGATEPELYARWVQFGALSPVLRLHATKDARAERRPWKYPEPVFRAAAAAFRLRYQLVPYLYTLGRASADTGLAPCRPMYYDEPEEEAAYAARYQYMLGDDLLAAPIVTPADPETGLASTDVWLPAGDWIDFSTGETFTGPRWVRLLGGLERVPILVHAGAVLPLAAPPAPGHPPRLASGTTDDIPRDHLVVVAFPGPAGRFRLYEDDGTTEDYRKGQYEWTELTAHMPDASTWEVQIAPAEGRCEALPRSRGYEVRLRGSRGPDRVTIDGEPTSDWAYDAATLTAVVTLPAQDKALPRSVQVFAADGITALGTAHNHALALQDVYCLLGSAFPADASDEALLHAAAQLTGRRQEDALARLGAPFVRFIEFTAPEEARRTLGRAIVGAPQSGGPFDVEVTFTLQDGPETHSETQRFPGTQGPLVVDAPFAWDGRVRPLRWSAKVVLGWRGIQVVSVHGSQPLFPTVPAWRVGVCEEGEGSVEDLARWGELVRQSATGLVNLCEPHRLMLSAGREAELQAGRPLVGYLAADVFCPYDRPAAIQFRCSGTAEVLLNGQPIELQPRLTEDTVHPLLRPAQVAGPVPLRAGLNRLALRALPPEDRSRHWLLVAALTTPDGEAMSDVTFGE